MAFKNTPNKDVPIICGAVWKMDGVKANVNRGIMMSPPPIPTSVPKVPTPIPTKNKTNISIMINYPLLIIY